MVLLASSHDQSKFFKAADLTQDKPLRIKGVTEEEIGVGQDKETKLVVWFTNDRRGLVLNRTNNRTIRGAFGDACDGWVGKIIVVFPTQDDFRGRIVPVLRVRIPPPKEAAGNGKSAAAKPATPPPEPPDELEEMLDGDDELNDEINF
jgi:hypothetical protein